MIQEMAYSCPRVGEVLPRAVMNVSTQAKEPSVPNLRMVRGVCRAMRLDGKQRVVLVLAAVLVLISGTQLDETASAVGYWWHVNHAGSSDYVVPNWWMQYTIASALFVPVWLVCDAGAKAGNEARVLCIPNFIIQAREQRGRTQILPNAARRVRSNELTAAVH
jgi:hypothetical protein